MHFAEQAAAPGKCRQEQQQQDPLMVHQPEAPLQGCPAPEAPTLDTQAGSQDASLLLDAATLHGMLQQAPLESHAVLEPAQQVTSSLPASSLGSAGSQEESRKQSLPIGAAVPGLAACLVPCATTAEAQLGSGSEQGLAPPCRPETSPTPPAVGAPLPVHASAAPLETAERGELYSRPSMAASVACASSGSLKAEILAKVDSMLGSTRLPASATVSSGGRMDSAGTAQAASEGTGSAGEGGSEAKDRLRALLQGGGLQQLAALLSSEESEIGSDFSDDSGSPSGNGISRGRGAAHSSQQASSYVEQEQLAGQSRVQSRIDITFLSLSHSLPINRTVLSSGGCFSILILYGFAS